MIIYGDFIPQNTAVKGAKYIGVYKGNNRVGMIPLGNLKVDKGLKLYSFGAVSDIHIDETNTVYLTSVEDCKRAFKYYNDNADVEFLCICGDLAQAGTREQLEFYKSMIAEYIPDKPVYVSTGNHEEYLYTSSEYYEEIVGYPLYYYFTHNDDVFIMVGIMSSHEDRLFEAGELDWLENVLEENRNKRCFVFEHVPTAEGCGDAFDIYGGAQLREHSDSLRFKELLQHYKKVIHFHGHSHFRFELQEDNAMANYDNVFGTHSVHIPSLTVPRGADIDNSKLTSAVEESQGYIVDVYENGIHLRGYDFVKGEFLPIASYWLDTTITEVEGGESDA